MVAQVVPVEFLAVVAAEAECLSLPMVALGGKVEMAKLGFGLIR